MSRLCLILPLFPVLLLSLSTVIAKNKIQKKMMSLNSSHRIEPRRVLE
jgi:hypothetical protein